MLFFPFRPDFTSGAFLHNAGEQWLDITNGATNVNAHYMAETGTPDVIFLLGPTPEDAVTQYASLTGVAPLPPVSICANRYSSFQDKWA